MALVSKLTSYDSWWNTCYCECDAWIKTHDGPPPFQNWPIFYRSTFSLCSTVFLLIFRPFEPLWLSVKKHSFKFKQCKRIGNNSLQFKPLWILRPSSPIAMGILSDCLFHIILLLNSWARSTVRVWSKILIIFNKTINFTLILDQNGVAAFFSSCLI